MISFFAYVAFIIFSWLLLAYFKDFQQKPSLPLSNVQKLPASSSVKVTLAKSVIYFFIFAAIFGALALCNPTISSNGFWNLSSFFSLAVKVQAPDKGSAIFLLIDESGSMADSVETTSTDGYGSTMAKIDITKKAAKEFIKGSRSLQGHGADLIGLVGFARVANILCPLTLDHKVLLYDLEKIRPVKDDLHNGTAIGYAIFKTTSLLVATKYFAERAATGSDRSYNIKNSVIIVLTDGLQSPHPDDKDDPFRYMRIENALSYAKANGIRVYIAEVDPIIQSPEFANDTRVLKEAVESTGGKLLLAGQDFSVSQILAQIDHLEKNFSLSETTLADNLNQTSLTKTETQESYAPVFIGLALSMFFIAIVLETCIVKSVP